MLEEERYYRLLQDADQAAYAAEAAAMHRMDALISEWEAQEWEREHPEEAARLRAEAAVKAAEIARMNAEWAAYVAAHPNWADEIPF
ncbi:MAG: hypothetical protein KGL39_39010 [Patescibacteria group bacterium]|nr:hypothetical protein [Patescibacteria group bacterium]